MTFFSVHKVKMAGLDGTQVLLIVLIVLVILAAFRPRRRMGIWDEPMRPRYGWWPERRAMPH